MGFRAAVSLAFAVMSPSSKIGAGLRLGVQIGEAGFLALKHAPPRQVFPTLHGDNVTMVSELKATPPFLAGILFGHGTVLIVMSRGPLPRRQLLPQCGYGEIETECQTLAG